MGKVLLYVDAENCSKESVTDIVTSVKSSIDGDIFIGKFYGKLDCIASMTSVCYELGLDFVETSTLVNNRKNVTDMKIVVDCVTDVCVNYRDDISRVILLSEDCDFIPLVRKLNCFGIVVELPIFEESSLNKTIADVDRELREALYDPMGQGTALEPQYPVIRELLPESYSDDLIKNYVDRKRRRFLKELVEFIESGVFAKLYEFPIEKFSFSLVCSELGLTRHSEEFASLLDVYTRKFFGKSYTLKTIRSKFQSD